MSVKRLLLLVLADRSKNPSAEALRLLSRRSSKVDVVIGNSAEEFRSSPCNLSNATAVLWIPPGSPAVLNELWAILPSVRWIHSWFAGLEPLHPFIKENLLNRDDVVVTNAKGAFSRSLAEYAIASALHFEKQVLRIMLNTQSKVWDKFPMGELHGKTMGFVGFGDIAKATARIAKHAFGMKVVALKRTRKGEKEGDGLADEVFYSERGDTDKIEVFRRSDYVVCSLPGTPETARFIGERELAAMKGKGGVLISIGRGSVVDEEALARALVSQSLRGAALDVFEVEPLPPSSPLWGLPNVLITAHNADWTPNYTDSALQVFEQNLDAFLAGRPLATPVDKAAGY